MNDKLTSKALLTDEQIDDLHQALLRIRMDYEALRIDSHEAKQSRYAAVRWWFESVTSSDRCPDDRNAHQ